MADRLFVEGLELYCVIGMQDWERQVQQRIRIDLEMEADCSAAGASDDVNKALDYRAVAKRVQALVDGSTFKLVEGLAEKIAQTILAEFPATASVKVRLAKPGAVRFADSVGVEIVRARARSQS